MKLKTILTLLAALGILTACNDDFFDQVPDDRITIEQVFQRTSYSEKYLATVYSYIRDESHRTNGVPWDPCSDDLDVTYDREDYNSFKMNLGNWSASSNYYEYWSHYYRGIRSATYFIQHIGSNQEMLDDPTRGPIVVEQYKNEARFLRAWFYYCLLRQYGPCVLLGDEVLPGDLDRDDVKMNLPRSSYDECVDYIVGELDDMIDNNRLPLHFTVQADKDYGRATLAMCMGLKSRVLLLAASDQFNGNPAYANVVNTDGKHLFSTRKDPEKWNKAAQAAKDVIDLGIFDLYKEYHTDGTLDPYLSCRNVFLENWNRRTTPTPNRAGYSLPPVRATCSSIVNRVSTSTSASTAPTGSAIRKPASSSTTPEDRERKARGTSHVRDTSPSKTFRPRPIPRTATTSSVPSSSCVTPRYCSTTSRRSTNTIPGMRTSKPT